MHSLLPYNTFAVPAQTHDLITIDETTDLTQALQPYRQTPKLIISWGSNILLIHDRPWVAIINQIRGRIIISEDEYQITIQLWAGENRHETVMRSVQQWYRWIENLALIPGTVGAAPIQNIGAYGAEAGNSIISVTYYDMIDDEYKSLTHDQCQFAYRDSIFKHELRGRALITSVTIKLSKSTKPILNYGWLQERFDHLWALSLKPLAIAQEVIQIRSSKLPDWTQIWTAWSFFKNPIISQSQLDQLLVQYPNCPHRDMWHNQHKVSAGRLLDHALWYKGKNSDTSPVGCRHQQALVLVNHGWATGQQVRDWAQHLIDICQRQLSITLEPEVNII